MGGPEPGGDPGQDREEARVQRLVRVEAGERQHQARRPRRRPRAAEGAQQAQRAQRRQQRVEQEEGDVALVRPQSDDEQRAGVPRGGLRIGEVGKAAVDAVGPQRDAALGPGAHQLAGHRMVVVPDVQGERAVSAVEKAPPGEAQSQTGQSDAGDFGSSAQRGERVRKARRHSAVRHSGARYGLEGDGIEHDAERAPVPGVADPRRRPRRGADLELVLDEPQAGDLEGAKV